jgi:hypothetical protein
MELIILELFLKATKEGLYWYAEAYDKCEVLAKEYGLSLEQSIGIVAVLSPKCPWDKNIFNATVVITGSGTPTALGANIKKANRILNGEPPLSVLSGNKVRSFYFNILRRGFDSNVTIDTHILRVIGRPSFTPKPGVYNQIVEAFRTVGKWVGYSPAQVQSVVWCYARKNVVR